MSIFKRLFPWYKEEDEILKDIRTEIAVLKAQKVESEVRKLAESYRAAGLVVKEVRRSRQ